MTSSLRASSSRDNFRDAQLLVVEDNPDHQVVIRNAVQRYLPEVELIVTANEAEAVSYLDRCRIEDWKLPKLILLDLYLPDRQSGWRLLDRIKTMPNALSKIPVVLLSHSGSRADITEAYQRGCSSYLVKPLQFSDWLAYFQILRMYWWETATLPKSDISMF